MPGLANSLDLMHVYSAACACTRKAYKVRKGTRAAACAYVPQHLGPGRLGKRLRYTIGGTTQSPLAHSMPSLARPAHRVAPPSGKRVP
jgi:hypothetical protein